MGDTQALLGYCHRPGRSVRRAGPDFLASLEVGLLVAERPGLSMISRGGDWDFFVEEEEPVAPGTFDAIKLDESDFITVSAMTYASANSGP